MNIEFEILKGKVLKDIIVSENDEIIFIVSENEKYKMYHYQDCYESVTIDDINGDLNDLIGSEILLAEEREEYEEEQDCGYSSTWTFYTLATLKGYVDIKWFGTSNGYYSESVDFEKI